MNYVHVYSYSNYIDANIILGRLKDEGIDGWLMDENTTTINPILGNAIGGIKLMVANEQAEQAVALLKQYDRERRAQTACPKCESINVDLVSSPRKASTWFGAIFGFLFGDYALSGDKVYHCFKCGHEFKLKTEADTSDPAIPS
jgi:Putative prokaryotic signal transducing protein